ncbi:carboxymuconolactone decarboxylase family protein [Pseudoxanthomonas wuyuanensis]
MKSSKLPSLKKWRIAATVVAIVAGSAHAQAPEGDRVQRGEAIVATLNGGQPQPALEALRGEFPFLADAVAGYALGEVWGRPVLDRRTRQLVTVSAFAAQGNLRYLKIHAGYALNLGVSEDELKEVVYLTTVHAGFPRAIDAAQVLSELFAERKRAREQE